RHSPAAAPTRSRSLAMSLVGVLPKKRPYSRLNCEGLTYPTCLLAVPASIIGDNIRRLASWRRSTFWYCNGLMDVTDLKCWWNDEVLMFANLASSPTFTGLEKLARSQATAFETPHTPDSARPIWARRVPMGP